MRAEVFKRLEAEGRAVDPTAGFIAAADPLIKKLWMAARQQAELASAKQIGLLKRFYEAQEADLAKAQASIERADAAEKRFEELSKSL